MIRYLILIGIVMVIGILLNKIFSKIPVPSLLIFIFLGMCFGENGIVGIEFNDYNISETICSTGLIVIMFYGGFGTNLNSAKNITVQASFLATFGVLFTAILTMLFCHYILELSYIEGFLIGSVISSTDAASVFNILRNQNLSLKYNTDSLLEMESGSNDPASYMLTVISCALLTSSDISIMSLLFKQIFFGTLIGIAIGKIAVYMLNNFAFGEEHEKTVLVLAIAILSYALTTILGGNGYLSVYLTGIYMGNKRIAHKRYLVHFFDVMTDISQLLIFFVLGLLVTPVDLPKVFIPAVMIMLFMTIIARPLVVYGILIPFKSKNEQMAVVSFSGLRGVASICFAIYAIMRGVNQTYDLFNLVFCVVLLSISIQGTLLPIYCRKLNMIDKNSDIRRTFNEYQEESDVNFTRIHIGENHGYKGEKIKNLKSLEGLLVAMIIRDNNTLIPNGETVIRKDDILVIAGREFLEQEHIILKEKEIGSKHKWCNKKLSELKLPENTLIIMIQKPHNDIIPTGNTVIEKNDIIVIAETKESIY